jgi:RND family efflux transporter MFP subunit
VLPQQVNEVTVMKLAKGNFNHELVSNGKIVAKEYADLYFRTSEVVAKVYVKNGMYVRKGQKLAELDLFKLNNTLTQNKNALAQANLEMQDVLIGQGYAPDNLSAVPAEKLELAKVKSGYERAKAQYEASLYDVEQATLIAPFDGVVANLFDKQYNMPKSGEPFCRIIRTSAMEVDFTVLESELPLIKVGDQVEVTPYATAVGTRTGNVSEINPLVDENGMVRVKAQVNGGEKLFDGMNVRISVKRSVPDQMVVPRTAIVLRAGKQVIFTVKDSIAMWNYVQTGLENLSEYTLVNWEASGLQEGMTVITTGNVNLAHETPVKIIEK